MFFAASHQFWYVVFVFICPSLFSNFPCDFFNHSSLRICCLISTNTWVFQFSSCYLFLTSSHCDQKGYFECNQNLLQLNCLAYGLSWKNVQCALEKNVYFVLGQNVLFNLLDLSCLLCYSSLLYFLGYLLSGYSVFENEVLKSSTVIVELFYHLNSVHFCFIYFDGLSFGS